MKNKISTIVDIGTHCKTFRIEVLKKSLKEVSNGSNIKTLSAFEHGRSKNIMHLFKYLESCSDIDDRIKFMKELCNIMGVENID